MDMGIHGQKDLNTTRSRWPVLALILDMPNASKSLEQFSLDRQNPINCRLDAYHMLSFIDKETTKTVAASLKNEIDNTELPDGGQMQLFVDSVQKQYVPFMGPVNFPSNGFRIGQQVK